MKESFDVLIVGGGIMGYSTAMNLSMRGIKTALIDQFPFENEFNASQCHNKIFRMAYSDQQFYTEIAKRSLPLWKELEAAYTEPLLFQKSLLLLSEHGAPSDYANQSLNTLKELDLPSESLNSQELQRRYSVFSGFSEGVLDLSAGFLDASTSTKAFRDIALKFGLTILPSDKITSIQPKKVTTLTGCTYSAKKIGIACGHWVKSLYPSLKIRPSKQQLLFLRPKDPASFSKETFPAWACFELGYYGFPVFKEGVLKISSHTPGEECDPEDPQTWKTDKHFEDALFHFIEKHLPALVNAEVIHKKVCLYDLTPTEDFIIDWVDKNVLLIGGFSGHGFKFAPFIGKNAAELLISEDSEQRFTPFSLHHHYGH